MSTFTFNPLVGMTSQTSVADKISYFEYDEYARLARIRDDEKNILKQYEYGYAAPVAGASCGTNCLVLPMQTLIGTTTLSYPVGVFNVTGKLLGNAENQTAYMNLWNANAENQAYGTLAAGGDAMYFNLTFNNGVTPPSKVIGCRYYMFDLSYNQIEAVSRFNAKYIDFGDSTGMYLGISYNDNTGVVLAPNTTEHFANGYYYYSHNYSDSSLKTLTFYHNDMAEESPTFGNGPSFVQATNLRGVFPQNANFFTVSCYPQPNGLTTANFSNWNTITSIKNFEIRNGDGLNSPSSSAPAQDFMANNRNLESISTNFYLRTGTSDPNLKFKISRLKGDWNIYFTQLKSIEINDDHWSREDLSQLKQLKSFMLLPVRQNLDVPNSPGVHIPSSVIDGIINQISSGAGQSVSNGSIFIVSGSSRTIASNSAVNHLKSKGWTIYINVMLQ
jgi:hypothetical protein